MNSSRALQRGVGLIEVLVSLLILAVTVMGFAGLQMRAVKAAGVSQYTVQATAIIEDLRERMAVNSINRDPSALDDNAVAYYRNPGNWTNAEQPGAPPNNCIAAACDQLQMARQDVQAVMFSAQRLLPNGKVRAEPCQNAAAQTCIYVAWGDTEPTAGANGECVDADGRRRMEANCVVWPQ